MEQQDSRVPDQAPNGEHHYGIGTTEIIRLIAYYMNTWKVCVSVFALFLIINGFLFYHLEQLKTSVPEPPTTAPTSQSIPPSAEDGKGRQAETQSEANDTQPDPSDYEQQVSSSYLRETESVATKDLSPYLSSTASPGQVQNDRSQLQEILEQLPDSQEVAQEQGVEDAVSQAAPQARETVGEAAEQAQDAAGQATDQVQETVEQPTEEAQSAVEGTAEQAQEAAREATEQAQGVGGSESHSGVVEEEEPDATHAARQKADELGVDLSEVEGSGACGCITLTDVVQAGQG